ALHIAGAAGRLRVFDFSFSLTNTYTFWSGAIGGMFLMLSYFGTDQSQVQRYLSAKSVDEARTSLLVSAYWKIPLQALVLVVGVLTFAFYLFTRPPMLFNTAHDGQIRASQRSADYAALQQRFDRAVDERREIAGTVAAASRAADEAAKAVAADRFRAAEDEVKKIRAEAVGIVKEVSGDASYNDVNYVFPTFVTTQLPIGI